MTKEFHFNTWKNDAIYFAPCDFSTHRYTGDLRGRNTTLLIRLWHRVWKFEWVRYEVVKDYGTESDVVHG